MRKFTLYSLLLAFVITGCVSTNASMLSSKTYQPVTPEEVTIYLSEDDIPNEFERVAIINASGSSGWTTESQMYEAVRKKAAELGANGVLHATLNEPSDGAKVAAAVFGTHTTRRGEMVAIFVHN